MAAGLGEAAAFATALGWAVSAYVHGVVGRMAGPVGVTMLRQPFQLAALGIVCLLLGEETFLSLKGLGLLTVSGITGFICCDLLLYGAMGIIGPQAAIQLASLSSGVTALLGMFFLGERLPLQAVAGIIITLVGVAIVLTERTGSTLLPGQEVPTGRRLVLGTAAGLGAAVFLSVSFIFLKQAMIDGPTPLWAAFVRLLVATLLLWGGGLFRGFSGSAVRSFRQNPGMFRLLLGATAFSAGGIWASSLALHHAPAGVAATIIGLQPVILAFVGTIGNRRRPSARAVAGSLVAFMGTALVCLR
jgi:drug/metabolite transporter (DMT)-like permease